jgi:hypothetical protein
VGFVRNFDFALPVRCLLASKVVAEVNRKFEEPLGDMVRIMLSRSPEWR